MPLQSSLVVNLRVVVVDQQVASFSVSSQHARFQPSRVGLQHTLINLARRSCVGSFSANAMYDSIGGWPAMDE